MNITVSEFISYFGGFDKVVIEEQIQLNKSYWSGTVDEWIDNPVKWLENKEVTTSSVVDGKLVVRIFAEE